MINMSGLYSTGFYLYTIQVLKRRTPLNQLTFKIKAFHKHFLVVLANDGELDAHLIIRS